MADEATPRVKRTSQQIAEDAATRAYEVLLTARTRNAKAKAAAEDAAAKYSRAEAKFQHAVTDIDVSDEFRDALAQRLAGDLDAETPTPVPTEEPSSPAGPSATVTSGREDYIDGLPEGPGNDGGVPPAEKPLPEDELAARIHEAATRGDIPREIGSPDEESDAPAVLEDSAEVPGEEPIVP